MKKQSGIYGFYHKESGRWYVGLSGDIPRRLRQHRSSVKTGERGRLYNAIRAYGFDAFEFILLEECPVKMLPEREKFWIIAKDSFYNGFNLTPGGEESPMCRPEVAAKVSATKKGKPLGPPSPETVAKRNASNKGRKCSAAGKVAMSLAQTGSKNGFYGKKWSDEAKAKRTANAAIKRAAREAGRATVA